MPSTLTYSVLDNSGERSGFTLTGATLNAGNIAAQVALVSGIQAALDDIILGTINREQLVASNTLISSTLPGSPYAQRELKLLFSYSDDVTGKSYTFTVPTPDLAALTIASGGDSVLLADADVMAAFVSAAEAYMTAPDTGNAVTINSCRIVGRNT